VYEALSYVLGSSLQTDKVVVSRSSTFRTSGKLIIGKKTVKVWQTVMYQAVHLDNLGILPIGRNLFIALKRLRCNDEARVLWIDAICINQMI